MTSLAVRSIESGYGEVQILWGASVELGPGKLTTILGSNGAGKTTLLRTIVGLLPAWKGSVLLDDRDVTRLPPHEKAELGVVLVPEGRQLFSTLTVLENLEMGSTPKHARATMRATIERARTAAGHSSASTNSSRVSRSGKHSLRARSPAASSRCWRSHAVSCPNRGS